jgi:hypothetical protein
MCTLAIIIPAYKANFLSETLQSLYLQSCKRFSVYIGNDAGDQEINRIVSSFEDKLNISYTSFSDNFGSFSLVKQWERCFSLVKNEEWFWILPDDDYVDPNCVEIFFQQVDNYNFDLFRFNIHFVTASGIIFKSNPPLKLWQSSFTSLIEKLSFKRPSTVAEFIFRKSKFDEFGFHDIPLAWGTDDLLWFLIGKSKGIRSTNNSFVHIRQSHLNISNNYVDLGPRKIASSFLFFEKLIETHSFLEEISNSENKIKFQIVALNFIIHSLQNYSLKLPLKLCCIYSLKGNQIWGGGILKNMRRFYLNNKRIAKSE